MNLNNEKDVNELLDLKLTYQPLRDEVVLNLPTKEEMEKMNKTASGLTLSPSAKNVKDDYVHTVLATGPDCKYVKVGDKVLLRPVHNGHPIVMINKKGYVQVTEFTIYGKVLENEDKKISLKD